MKITLKKITYKFFRLITKFRIDGIAHKIINFGYLLLSEKHVNQNGAKTVGWDRIDFHPYLSKEIYTSNEAIDYLEFGVFKGDTLKIWVVNNKNPESYFGGFDTFSGLPESWGNIVAGTFSAEDLLPDVNGDKRVEFIKGLIQDTLPIFLEKYTRTNKKLIVHIDVDLYNATLITLILMNPFFIKGDIVIFDDFHTLTKTEHEFKAYLDYLSLYGRKIRPAYNVNHDHFVMEFE